jgi:hypothetical protein
LCGKTEEKLLKIKSTNCVDQGTEKRLGRDNSTYAAGKGQPVAVFPKRALTILIIFRSFTETMFFNDTAYVVYPGT